MTASEPHIVKSFDNELRKLEDAITRMGGLAEAQLAAAIDALDRRDNELAARVAEGDASVDALEDFVNEQTIRLLALRAPLANDLRMVVAGIKVAGDIERIADHAANAAKRAIALNDLPQMAPMRSLVRLGWLVIEVLKEALDAYAGRDDDRALAVRARDEEVDCAYSSLFREILTYMMEDPRTISGASHLMFIAKNIERVGDHATNIAEMTHFMVTGNQLTDQRPKHDATAVPTEGLERTPPADRRKGIRGRRKRDRED